MRKVIANKKPAKVKAVPVTPPKTLTLRLNSDQAARLEEIMKDHGRKTASGMIEQMIDDWTRLQNLLTGSRRESAQWQDHYIALKSDTEALRVALVQLLERVGQDDMFRPQ